MRRVGVVIFPGSNCDMDMKDALRTFKEIELVEIWHKDETLPQVDAIMLPGGFTYGDYLRCGAMARFSPAMEGVSRFAEAGGPVLGVCNGFQILVEAGLLPGALLRNKDLKFLCQDVYLRAENTTSPFTNLLKPGEVLRIPIAHYEGSYFLEEAALDELVRSGRVAFRYCGPAGEAADAWNPNGSVRAIAGVTNARGNVLGLMPHPERHVDPTVGGADGRRIFESLLAWLDARDRSSGGG